MEIKHKKPFYKQWWFILIVAVFIIGGIGSALSDDDDEVKEDEETEDVAVEQDEDEEGAEVSDDRTIDEVLSDENDVDRSSFESGTLRLERDVTSFWDETSILKQDVLRMFELLPKAFEDDEVERVRVVLNTEMVDQKGNAEMESVIYYEYTREHFEELDYDNFLNMATSETWRILNESTSYEIHPGIYQKVDNNYKNNLNTGLSKIEE